METSFLAQEDYLKKVLSVTHVYTCQPRVFVRTYGCQQNFADSEKIRGMFLQMGYQACDDTESADVIVYNTCAVRENAEDRVFGNVGALKHLKARKPHLKIILCGCMVQQEQVASRLYKTFPFIDLIFGTHMLARLPEMMFHLLMTEERDVRLDNTEGIVEDMPILRENDYQASISIMYGCDNFCTYCIVPYVRGRERSRKPEHIVKEFKQCLESGCKEFTLLGQNVNSFGKGTDTDFPDLLKQLDSFEGEYVINFMTSHPKDCSNKLIDTVAESKHISHHIHLPIQSGSNAVLQRMNRGYTKEQYTELAEYGRAKIPDLSLTTDIIVGFPGETYEEFCETLELVRNVKFDSAFTFIYSKREGTVAAEMDDPVSLEEKQEWFNELLAVQAQAGKYSYHQYVGQTLKVLCSGRGRSDKTLMTGKCRNGVIVDFNGDDGQIGQFVNVKITEALSWALIGTTE